MMLRTAFLEQGVLVGLAQVDAMEEDLSSGRLVQLGNGTHRRALAASRFTDNADGLSLVDVEAYSIDGTDVADRLLEQSTSVDGEVLSQVLHLKNDLPVFHHLSPPFMASCLSSSLQLSQQAT